jgi:hypothetical protein
MTWVIRDDDHENGVTYVDSWRLVPKGLDIAEATWTDRQSHAVRFDHPMVATLVSLSVGGTVVRLTKNTKGILR